MRRTLPFSNVPLLLLVLLLAACSAGNATPSPVATQKGTISQAAATETSVPVETIAVPTPVPDPTITMESRLPAERWQEWPIIPQVTGRAIEIYRRGLSMNLDPNAFSKVGDCQSVKAAFMGYWDTGDYSKTLKDLYPNLQETIDQFKGHFNTDGQAVRGGFLAPSVLSPLWADPHACEAGENPLDCELRITRPILVFIRLERPWDYRKANQYEGYMRQILDDIIAHGAVPILATKADNIEGNNAINLTTAKLAVEYDLPLWNFWAAVQPLPNHGMETKPPHNDGFHISIDAWSVASFTGLQALDNVWRGLLAAGPASLTVTPTSGSTPVGGFATPSASALPTTQPTVGPTPQGGSEKIIFGLASRSGEIYTFKGVYLLDLVSRITRKIFGEGVRLQSASPDGKYLLVSHGSSLYRSNIDGADLLHLSDALYEQANTAAVWLQDGSFAALLTRPSGKVGISILSAEGALMVELPLASASPVDLYSSVDPNHVYWESGSCAGIDICNRQGAWVSGAGDSLPRPLAKVTTPLVSPRGDQLASPFPVSATEDDLGLAKPDGSNLQQVALPGKMLLAYSWSRDGSALTLTQAEVSDYSGLSSGNRNFLVDPVTWSITELPNSDLLNPHLLWSPDGSSLFWLGTLPDGNGFNIGAELVDVKTKQVTDLSEAVDQSAQDYLLVTNAAWLPLP